MNGDLPPGFQHANALTEPDDYSLREDLVRHYGYTVGWLGTALLSGALKWTTEAQMAARWPDRQWQPGMYIFATELRVARAIQRLGGEVTELKPGRTPERYAERPQAACPRCSTSTDKPAVGAAVCPHCQHVWQPGR